jgi:hypothetical protein
MTFMIKTVSIIVFSGNPILINAVIITVVIVLLAVVLFTGLYFFKSRKRDGLKKE